MSTGLIITGTPGPDTLVGGVDDDTISGLEGNDSPRRTKVLALRADTLALASA